MPRFLKYILFTGFVLFAFCKTPYAQNIERKDTVSEIKIRIPEKINSFLENEDFQYNTKKSKPPEGFLKRLLYRISLMIRTFFYLIGKGGNIVAYLFYGFILIAVIFVLAKLLDLTPYGLIIKSKNIKSENIPVFEDDINATDFDSLIFNAEKEKNYRFAIRFLYIKLLKKLSEKELIEWKKEKTNNDYKREMQNSKYKKQFVSVTNIFNYVWYGEFKISEKMYSFSKKEFEKLFENLK